LELAKNHPEWLHAYIGVGQLTNRRESEHRGWIFALNALVTLETQTPSPNCRRLLLTLRLKRDCDAGLPLIIFAGRHDFNVNSQLAAEWFAKVRAPSEPPSQEDTHFDVILSRTYKEVAGFPREHDRVMRGVDTLLTESSRRFTQPPRLAEIIGKTARQSGFRCAPAIMRFSLLDPLLAVVTFVTGH
jgi:hypothetical protein